MEQQKKDELIRTRKDHLTIAIGLMVFAFLINRGIEIKGLYMDDLYMWSCFGEQSFSEFVFPIGGTRCRFIFYLVSYLEMALIGVHVNWMVPINIFLNGLVAITVYGMAQKLSRSKFVGALMGVMYLLSRLSYYQISQGWGLMETMALWLAILILYSLYRFLNDTSENNGYYVLANVLYFAICFVHERYMVLLPLLFLVLVMKKEKNLRRWLETVLTFALVQGIRFLAIGGLLPAGTGGTQVADTFDVKSVIRYALAQVAYLFGINAGPEHLNGIAWNDTPRWLHLLVYAAIVTLLLMGAFFVRSLILHKKERKSAGCNSVLFLCFIGACIVSSSVTIRLEMRWVYVSFTAALLYLSYLYGVITKDVEGSDMPKKLLPYGILITAYVVLMFPVELCYRSCYPNLYYWSDQLRYNSLAEETYEKYGDAIFDKKIYLIGDTYQISDFTAQTFFKVYDKEKKFEGAELVFVDDIEDIGLVTDQMLVLREEPSFQAFQDITQFVRDLKCQRIEGYYEDGWMDEEATVKVMAGSGGTIDLEMVYPGNLTGHESSTLYVDGEQTAVTEFTDNIMHLQIKAKPRTVLELKFVNNFYLEGAQEQRGTKRFSMLVTMKAD